MISDFHRKFKSLFLYKQADMENFIALICVFILLFIWIVDSHKCGQAQNAAKPESIPKAQKPDPPKSAKSAFKNRIVSARAGFEDAWDTDYNDLTTYYDNMDDPIDPYTFISEQPTLEKAAGAIIAVTSKDVATAADAIKKMPLEGQGAVLATAGANVASAIVAAAPPRAASAMVTSLAMTDPTSAAAALANMPPASQSAALGAVPPEYVIKIVEEQQKSGRLDIAASTIVALANFNPVSAAKVLDSMSSEIIGLVMTSIANIVARDVIITAPSPTKIMTATPNSKLAYVMGNMTTPQIVGMFAQLTDADRKDVLARMPDALKQKISNDIASLATVNPSIAQTAVKVVSTAQLPNPTQRAIGLPIA